MSDFSLKNEEPKEPSSKDIRCGTCAFWKPELSKRGYVAWSEPGLCTYQPHINLPKMPKGLELVIMIKRSDFHQFYTNSNRGCEFWGRKVK